MAQPNLRVTYMTDQIKAIIAHITPIGWIIALVLNLESKDPLTRFYLRQNLGIYLISVLSGLVPIIGWAIGIVALVLWIISLIGAIQQTEAETPLVGKYFQDWFSIL